MSRMAKFGYLLLLAGFVPSWLGACADIDADDGAGRVHAEPVRTLRSQPLRPTDAEDARGYHGAQADSIVSPSGGFRVWWAPAGQHAVPAADVDSNGVPDYVEMVAEVADEVAQRLHQAGWKLAMGDQTGDGEPAPGGDGLFDIYLVDFENGDGQFVPDWCAPNAHGVAQCAGHFRMENDFAGLNYPTPEYAARLVLSHEYFHAVQAAYAHDLPSWWSEGSATWFEEYFDPAQDDFERLASIYFQDPARALNDRTRGATDPHAYGGSIFVYFLEQHVGADGIRRIFERLATGEPLLEAIDRELRAAWVPLVDAFEVFAVYNLFTGERAVAQHGYPEAARFAGVAVEALQIERATDWHLDANPLGARYLKLSFERAISLQFRAFEDFEDAPRFIAVNQDDYATSGSMHLIDEAVASEFDPSMSPLYVVVANGHVGPRRAATLKIRLVETGEPQGPDDSTNNDDENNADLDEEGEVASDSEALAGSSCSTSGGGVPLSPVFFAVFFVVGICRRGC